MTRETFSKALDFAVRTESTSWKLGAPALVFLSGGECTEHPDIVSLVEEVIGRGLYPVLISNGMWLANTDLRGALLRPEWPLRVQVTHDPRFYPSKPPPRIEDPRITYVDSLSLLVPLGRAGRRENLLQRGVPLRKAPTSYNLRSLTRSFKSFTAAVCFIRLRALSEFSGHCIPSVSSEGQVMAGETRNCFVVGTVDSTERELTEQLINMRCNNCGLVDNLTEKQKEAIGET